MVETESSQNQATPSASELRDIIRTAGLRSTAPRVAVLQRLMTASTPLSHAEISVELADQGFDRATLYRNLMDLTEVGLVIRSDHGDHIWRFELRRERAQHESEHPHFVCVDCGTVTCLPEVVVPIPTMSESSASVIGKISEVVIKGQCSACS